MTINQPIDSILCYHDNVMKLVNDFRPEAIPELDEDTKLTLEHMFDYDSVCYTVICNGDHEQVITSDPISGTIFGIENLEEFITLILEYAKEN